jgi:hypothetical protein
MFTSAYKKREVGIFGAGILCGVCVMAFYGLYHFAQFNRTIATTEETLAQLFLMRAEEADNIEQTEESAQYVHDCEARARFEQLLSALPLAKVAERTELDVLFASCAGYHASLKSHYVRELRDIHTRYAQNMYLAHTLMRPEERHSTRLEQFGRIVAAEDERALLMRRQVDLQRELLALYGGKSSPRSVAQVTEENTTVATRLLELNATLDTLRAAHEEVS